MAITIQHHAQWSKTSAETPIELYHSSDVHLNSIQKVSPILFIGGVHGDEPEGVRLANELLLWLKKHASEQKLQHLKSWILIPCINPDGYRKNERTNSRGVDLNRNFPSKDWSNEHTKPRYYPGEFANSELETQALVSLIHNTSPVEIIHFHSWDPCIVYTGEPGRKTAQILAQSCGYEAQETIGYPTPGSLGQYGWLNHQTPVICIEEQEGCDQNLIWSRFEKGFHELLYK